MRDFALRNIVLTSSLGGTVIDVFWWFIRRTKHTHLTFFRALKAQCLYPVTNMETESNINKGTDVQSQTFINKARHQPKIQNVSPVALPSIALVHWKVLLK